MLSSGRHLLSLINDILDVSKIEAGKVELRPEWTALGATLGSVREVVQPLADKRGVSERSLADGVRSPSNAGNCRGRTDHHSGVFRH